MRLFLYGTLMQGSCSSVAMALHRRLEPGVPARTKGVLFAIPDPDGWYPALILGGSGDVCGMVHAVRPAFAEADLAALDAYEDYHPGDPAGSLYLRREVMACSGGATFRAQAYIYNAALPAEAQLIPGGDFRAFLAARGLPEFR